MRITNTVKYGILKRPLKLAKIHDFCVSRKPRLTVVMLHGIASSAHTYDHALKYFKSSPSMKNIRFVTYDWLGAGKSFSAKSLCYDIDEELMALKNSLEKLKIKTPLILVGHSMGTMLVAHYASTFPKEVAKLILVSPPIYTEKDLKDPIFEKGMEAFRSSVAQYNAKIIKGKPFNAQMKNIVKNPTNYKAFSSLKTPTFMIYGALDPFISHDNVEKVARSNKLITAIKTDRKHSVSRDKYAKILEILEDTLNENL